MLSMDKVNDQHYVNLVIAGDTNAFAALVGHYKDMVFTLSLKMLQNREEAEEAAQDTFIKIYRSLGRFKGESKFSTWIYQVTYNNCLDRLRKQKRSRTFVDLDEFAEYEVRSLMDALDTIEEAERKQMIKNCLNLLAPEENFLLTLYYFNEASINEISVIMNINVNNVKIKLFRTRKKLAAILKTKLEPQIINKYEKQGR